MVVYTCKDCKIEMPDKDNKWADVFLLRHDWCDACIDKDYDEYVATKTGRATCYTDDYNLDEGNYV